MNMDSGKRGPHGNKRRRAVVAGGNKQTKQHRAIDPAGVSNKQPVAMCC